LIRSALARAGIDAAQATRLCLADEADAALAALSDTPAAEAQDRARDDAFDPKILALARGFADAPPPDFARASFAELYAWSLAQPPAE
jgi:enoyl-CoA hydratase/carnithine racemase